MNLEKWIPKIFAILVEWNACARYGDAIVAVTFSGFFFLSEYRAPTTLSLSQRNSLVVAPMNLSSILWSNDSRFGCQVWIEKWIILLMMTRNVSRLALATKEFFVRRSVHSLNGRPIVYALTGCVVPVACNWPEWIYEKRKIKMISVVLVSA